MDIHERDTAYLAKSYANACAVCEKFGWTRILCTDGGHIRTVEDISTELCTLADGIIKTEYKTDKSIFRVKALARNILFLSNKYTPA